jgi:hypothetical protein
MNKILEFDTVIYHNPCNDGAVALWCANYYKEIQEKIPCKAGHLPNLVSENKNILFVDLCPKFEYLFEICKTAKNVVILDHHKTSIDAFELCKSICPVNLHVILDNERSGCQITWDYFHQLPRPWFVDYTGDRDLWTWKLPNSREITQVFFENNMLDPYYLDNITKLIKYTGEQINDLVKEGSLLLKFQKKQIDMACSRALEAVMIVNEQKYNVWLGTMTNGDRSELGNSLANKPLNSTGLLPDFSATWIYEPKFREWWISLRGHKFSPDLSNIAGFYDGGGHKNSSAFTIKYPKTLHDIFLIK